MEQVEIGLLSRKKLGLRDVGRAADWDGLIILDQTSNMGNSQMMKIESFALSLLALEAGGQ